MIANGTDYNASRSSVYPDAEGNEVDFIVPIELWHEIESERETAYPLKNETMKRRLLEAKNRKGGISLEDALERVGMRGYR